MFRTALGFILGVGISVMYYDYGLTPVDLAEIVIKNGNDIVEEVQDISNENRDLTESITDYHNFIPQKS